MSSINDAVRSAAKNAISECPVGFEAHCKILEVVLQHWGSHKHWASDAAWALLHDAEFKASLPDGVGHTELQVGGTTLHKRYKRRQPAGDVVDVDAPQADNIADEPQEPPDLGALSADLGATSGDEGAIMKACPTCNTMVAACGWANHVENCQPVPADPLPPPPVNDKWPCRRRGVIRKTEHARLQHEKFCEGPRVATILPPVPCPFNCGKIIGNIYGVEAHEAKCPLNPASLKPKPVAWSLEPVKCPKCGKQFKDKNGLVGHEPICPMRPSTGKFLPLGQLQRKNFHNPFWQICPIIAELLFAFLPQQMWILLVLCRRVYDALVPFKAPKPQIPMIVEHVGNESGDNLDSGEWMWGGSIDSGLGEPTAHVTGSISTSSSSSSCSSSPTACIAPPPPPPPQPVAPMQPPTGSSSTGPLPIPSRASTASVAKPHAVAPMQPPVFPVVTPNPLKTVEGLDLTWSFRSISNGHG